jgi:dihydrofolate reductase
LQNASRKEAAVGKIRVSAFTLSIDGYGAGPDQSLENPLGRSAEDMHEWMTETQSFHELYGGTGTTGADDDFVRRSFANLGAWIMGRNMFGPVRGPWPDESWRGWWGENPPYHVPVFVLTHYARPPLEMDGGTVFHFVTGGPDEALERAREAAAGKDVRVGGGAETIRHYLKAGAIDEMHLAISPILLGGGESLLAGLDLPAMGFKVAERVATERALHVVLQRGDKA